MSQEVQDTPPAQGQPERSKSKENRFTQSRRLKEEFLTGVLADLKELNQYSANKTQAWSVDEYAGIPFNAKTGHSFSGANQAKLVLTAMRESYSDNRWVTFKQIDDLRKGNPDLARMHIRKGEEGIRLLRPQEVSFFIPKDGQLWKELDKDEQGNLAGIPQEEGDVKKFIVFHPYVVFNASQIEGFPMKETPEAKITSQERLEYAALLSVAANLEHATPGDLEVKTLNYSLEHDAVMLPKKPDTAQYSSKDEYLGSYLQEVFRATGHPSRENRLPENSGKRERFFESMSAQIFSVLAAGALGYTIPKSDNSIPAALQLAGKEKQALLKAVANASDMLTTFDKLIKKETVKPWLTPVPSLTEKISTLQACVANLPDTSPKQATPPPAQTMDAQVLNVLSERLNQPITAIQSMPANARLALPMTIYTCHKPYGRLNERVMGCDMGTYRKEDYPTERFAIIGVAHTFGDAKTMLAKGIEAVTPPLLPPQEQQKNITMPQETSAKKPRLRY